MMVRNDSPAIVQQVVWRQAVQFEQAGGWSDDCQFIYQMGFPYLLATGLGAPVDDAVSTAQIPRAGEYRLWVRCKDWLPGHSPGRFQVIVGGRAADTQFGCADTADWQWSDGGLFSLDQGSAELRLHDCTGWWGRCDAIVLSGEPSFRPSEDLDELWQQRITYGAVSATIHTPPAYDVLIVGGGLAGAAAAVSAARHGCRVALLQDRPVLGGNASSEILVPALGDETREPWDPRETGIIEEFDPRTTGKAGWSANVRAVVDAEPNIDLYLNLRSTSVQCDDRQMIRSVEGFHTRSGQRYRFESTVFIDCTGDAALGAAAGAEFRQGREARSEFHESLAPPKADRRTMGNTLFGGRIENCDECVPFETPAWAYQWKRPEDFEQRSTAGVWSTGELPAHFTNLERGSGRPPENAMGPVGCWFAEWGGMEDTVADAEHIRDELFRICIGIWGYVKNHDPTHCLTNEKRKLMWLNHIAGKRESRRLMGDYVLTQRDYAENVVHADTIAYGGWTIDDHHPQGYFSPGPIAYHAYLQKVSIPYRSLYSRNINNLMMAGRNLSATHVGFGGVRVMRTCCQMGQAAGTAAAIAVRNAMTPRGVHEMHIDELQQTLLKDGAYLLGVENHDPLDLARTANVTASSFAEGSDPSWLVTPISNWGTVHRLDTTRAVMFRAPATHIDQVSLFLRSQSTEPTRMQLSLAHANDLGDFQSGEFISAAEVLVPGSYAGWIDVALRAETVRNDYYYLKLPPKEKMEWELYPYHPPGTLRGYDGPRWGALWGCYKFRLTPGGEPAASAYAASNALYVFSPEQVINGSSRAVDGAPCSWAPAPQLPLPQHIQLDFPAPVCCNSLHVTFQLAKLAPSAYTIQVFQEQEWHHLLRVKDNRSRRRVHSFDPLAVDAVRLEIDELPSRRPGPLTPICEIRIYRESRQIDAKGVAT